MRKEKSIFKNNIQFLKSVDTSANETRTIVTVIDCCLKVKEQLRLKYIVCAFDQAIYCKAMELKRKKSRYVK